LAEKRKHRRHRRRLTVKYGQNDLATSGLTMDVSISGAFIIASQMLPLDTRLHVQIFFDKNHFALFEAVVKRQKVVPPGLQSIEHRGFGVRFLGPGEVLSNLLAGPSTLELRFADAPLLKAAYDRELKMGGAFLPTTRVYPRGAKVTVEFFLEFADRSFEISATVVHVSDGTAPQTAKGIAVTFDDRAKFETLLKPFLESASPPA
jgi:Tfp pilus assembly protein PilZ